MPGMEKELFRDERGRRDLWRLLISGSRLMQIVLVVAAITICGRVICYHIY